MKILDVCKNPIISPECWTYYKFAIMQTSPSFDEWLTNHMKVYLDSSGTAIFGEDGRMYPITYYSDILCFEEFDIFSLDKKNVVDFIIKRLMRVITF